MEHMKKSEDIKELEDILIGLLIKLDAPMVDQMIALAIMRAANVQQDMINWVATFIDKEDLLTADLFMRQLKLQANNVQIADNH